MFPRMSRLWKITQLGGLLFVLLACNLAAPAETPGGPGDASSGTPTGEPADAPTEATTVQPPAVSPSPPVPASETAAPAETASVTPPGTQAGGQLTSDGPWLVYHTAEGLVAANADGSSPTRLLARLAQPYGEIAVSPAGGWSAFLTAEAAGSPPPDITLSIMHLPEGLVNSVEALLSERILGQLGGPERPPEAAVALTQNDILSWSPDGRFLAYIGAFEGISTDLYVYDTGSGQRRRLTDGVTETATLSWSPDSRWIVHQAVENFGTGAGWKVRSVWAAAVDGSEVKELYKAPEDSGGEVFLGWTSANVFMAYSWTASTPAHLRAVSADSGMGRILSTRHFNDAAMSTPTGTAAIAVDAFAASLDGEQPGVYLLPTQADAFEPVESGEWNQVSWARAAGRFLAKGEAGTLVFSPEGTSVLLPQEAWAEVSPYGQWIACWGSAQFDPRPGARLYTLAGQQQVEITADSVDFLLWRPDSQAVVYLSGGELYWAPLTGGTPQRIAGDVQAGREGGLAWVTK